MKPLRMLDQVMLWIARVFVIYNVWELLVVARDLLLSQYRWLIFFAHGHIKWHLAFNLGGLFFPFIFVVVSLWALSLFCLRYDAGRLFLALSGLVLIGAFVDLACSSSSPSHADLIYIGSSMVGFFAMIWTGIRAPGQLPIKLTPFSRQHIVKTAETPRYFSFFFRSVMPV